MMDEEVMEAFIHNQNELRRKEEIRKLEIEEMRMRMADYIKFRKEQEYRRTQEILEKRQLLLRNEDAACKIFDIVCKSIEDESFAKRLEKEVESVGDYALILAQFGQTGFPDLSEIYKLQCVENLKPRKFSATGLEISDQIYNGWNRFSYLIQNGPFKGWYVRPTYVRSGLPLVGTYYTGFSVQKSSWFCRLVGF